MPDINESVWRSLRDLKIFFGEKSQGGIKWTSFTLIVGKEGGVKFHQLKPFKK